MYRSFDKNYDGPCVNRMYKVYHKCSNILLLFQLTVEWKLIIINNLEIMENVRPFSDLLNQKSKQYKNLKEESLLWETMTRFYIISNFL